MTIRAALFDFGGVVTSSPFEAFARHEHENGLPHGFLRSLNATNPDTNAWARFERSELDVHGFRAEYEAEARAAGHEIDALAVLDCLSGDLRPAVITAIKRCRERLRTGCITNNIATMHDDTDGQGGWGRIVALDELFDVVIESSKAGVRKPDRRIYELACDALDVEPSEVVFVDDLGVNLKPAREMGMTTIKVLDEAQLLADLEVVVGFSLG